jgi:hypothetical protein
MVEKNRCPKCRYVYEVSWDDNDDSYYCDDVDDTNDIIEEDLYPEYCPFCGTHHHYGTEGDSYDDMVIQ